MKILNKALSLLVAAGLVISVSACGTSGNYSAYSDAYEAMAASGSMDADFDLNIVTSEENVNAFGNMKMDVNSGELYLEMSVGDTTVIQSLQDGVLYTDIDGQRSQFSTTSESNDNERPKTEGGTEEKDNAESFELETFLEELATMLEATKIREMGLLDPIPESVISEITSESDSSGTTYTLVLSDTIVDKIFNVMIEEQVSDSENALSFEDLQNFECTMHANSDGVLDGMTYGGSTSVTVPASLTGGEAETFDMTISIEISFNNPGSTIDIPDYDVSEF